MAAEMHTVNQEAYDHFNGIGHSASRNTRTIFSTCGAATLDESAVVPLYGIDGSNVATVSIQYILDRVYCKDGGRRTPRNLNLGKSVFD